MKYLRMFMVKYLRMFIEQPGAPKAHDGLAPVKRGACHPPAARKQARARGRRAELAAAATGQPDTSATGGNAPHRDDTNDHNRVALPVPVPRLTDRGHSSQRLSAPTRPNLRGG